MTGHKLCVSPGIGGSIAKSCLDPVDPFRKGRRGKEIMAGAVINI
jgi:hypothetical protein